MTDNTVNDWTSLESISGAGFVGFHTIAELRVDASVLPAVRGVYVIVRDGQSTPEFLETGSGGFFKGKDPNVAIELLRANWVSESPVLYIGKAGDPGRSATLRSRIGQYLRFGTGKNVGHWGGRYVWQLSDSPRLRFAWIPLPDGHPSAVESSLIQSFRAQLGDRPFANLVK